MAIDSRPLRITVVLRKLALGGAERQAVMLANGFLDRLRAEVNIISFSPGCAVPNLLHPSIGIRVIEPGSDGNWLKRLIKLGVFAKALRSTRPDILLPFTDYPNKVLGAVWRTTGASACIWNQRDEGREVTHRPLERLSLRLVSGFVANSEIGCRHLEDAYGIDRKRITLIRNGVRLLPPLRRSSEWREELGIAPKTLVAIMVAHLHHFKDHKTLLRAWRRVVDHLHSPAVLLLAGNRGETFALIESLRKELDLVDSVKILGTITDISGLLSACDLSIFSSRLEGCPNAVLESMAASLPVVATDIVGTREALGESYPYLVPESDHISLADAILHLSKSPAEGRSLGEANRSRVENSFSPEKSIDAYDSLFKRLCESKVR